MVFKKPEFKNDLEYIYDLLIFAEIYLNLIFSRFFRSFIKLCEDLKINISKTSLFHGGLTNSEIL